MWYCTTLDNAENNSDNPSWEKIGEFPYDAEHAASVFMEEHEDTGGSFGRDPDAAIFVIVYDDRENQKYLVRVLGDPQPGYSPIDYTDVADDYYQVSLKDFKTDAIT